MPDFRLSVQLYSPDIQVSRHLYIIMTTLLIPKGNPLLIAFRNLAGDLLDSGQIKNEQKRKKHLQVTLRHLL